MRSAVRTMVPPYVVFGIALALALLANSAWALTPQERQAGALVPAERPPLADAESDEVRRREARAAAPDRAAPAMLEPVIEPDMAPAVVAPALPRDAEEIQRLAPPEAPAVAEPMAAPLAVSPARPLDSLGVESVAQPAAPVAVEPLTPPAGVTPARPPPAEEDEPRDSTPVPGRKAAQTVIAAPRFTPQNLPPDEDEPAYEPGQLLVLWTSAEAAEQGLATLAAQYQLRPRQRSALANLGVVVAMIQLPTDREARALRDQLRAEHPDWVVDFNARLSAAQGPRLYAHAQLGLPARMAAGLGADLSAVRIGVVDGPTDADAALQVAALIRRSVLSPADEAPDTTHGNAIALLLAGAPDAQGFVGAAPGITLAWVSALRVIKGQPRSHSLLLALALDWLLAQRVQLVNLSLGGRRDAVQEAVIRRVIERGVRVIAAAGNGGPEAEPVFPAALPGVLAITAVDALQRVYPAAQRGDYIALAAPGVDVWVPASADGGGSYVSGTSFAAALVSGSLAQLGVARLQDAPLVQTLCASAKDLGTSGRDEVFGCGLLRLP